MIIKYIISALLLSVTFVHADILKENFITFDLNATPMKVSLDIESDNFEKLIALDDNKNGIISWNELYGHQSQMTEIILSHVDFSSDKKSCTKELDSFKVYRRVHQSYLKLDLSLLCPKPKTSFDVKYTLFFDIDKDQKAFVKINDQKSKPVILSSRKTNTTLVLEKHSLWNAFMNFLVEGIWHIWMGYDHILFLLMLLIPSVYVYKDKSWFPRNSFKDVFIQILKVVTGFSVAHSITLGLSVSEIVVLDSRFVEVAIALSILFTAINNLQPIVTKHAWLMAFAFGLIHGFGFANVLHDLIIKNSSDFLAMLFGFNLGVEIGQMAIVMILLPFLYLLEKTTFYKRYILHGFSIVAAIIAVLWAYERTFGLNFMPF